MQAVRKHLIDLYANKLSRQWVVRDGDGNFWVLPSSDNCWERRQPFYPTDDMELEPVPGHYKYMLGLPDYWSPTER